MEDPFIASGIASRTVIDRDPLAPTMDSDEEEGIPAPNPSFEAIVSLNMMINPTHVTCPYR